LRNLICRSWPWHLRWQRGASCSTCGGVNELTDGVGPDRAIGALTRVCAVSKRSAVIQRSEDRLQVHHRRIARWNDVGDPDRDARCGRLCEFGAVHRIGVLVLVRVGEGGVDTGDQIAVQRLDVKNTAEGR
jgi:hypothetical protein